MNNSKVFPYKYVRPQFRHLRHGISFLDNKYSRWYFSIIERAKIRTLEGYVERHHIIPSSLGGENGTTNKVKLTAREHFICHLLLVKMLPTGKARNKLVWAAGRMAFAANGQWSGVKYRSKSSKLYEMVRKQLAEAARGSNHPQFGKKKGPMRKETKAKLSNARRLVLADGSVSKKISAALVGRTPWNKGRSMSDEQRAKVSAVHRGKTISEAQKKKISEKLKGRAVTDEQRRQRSENMKRHCAKMKELGIKRKRKRKPTSEETKQKIRQAALMRSAAKK